MRNNLFLLFALFLLPPFLKASEKSLILSNPDSTWRLHVNAIDGHIEKYEICHPGQQQEVLFRADAHKGPAYEGISLINQGSLKFENKKDDIFYQLHYQTERDHPVLVCTVTNMGKAVYSPERLRLYWGVNSEMHCYPEWDKQYFPTMVRCEKNFAWGYFMSPKQEVFAFACEDPVASYGLNYIYEGWLKWKWGHQIKTASFDLLHSLPLPQRHPQNQTSLLPGESKTWTIHFGMIEDLNRLQPVVSEWSKASLVELSEYTVEKGKEIEATFQRADQIQSVRLINPHGKNSLLSFDRRERRFGKLILPSDTLAGLYRLIVKAKNGKEAEATYFIRNSWSWYMQQGRDFVATNPPLFSNSCETFYSYYTAFLGAKHFPAPQKDKALENHFNKVFPHFIDTVSWTPQSNSAPDRLQNFSSLLGILIDLWEATQNMAYLEKAAHIGDLICSARFQWEDGSYRSKQTHYTAVIYPAKSMLELVEAEKRFIHDPIWKERVERHYASAEKAVNDLLVRRDNIQTEGDLTFEDGMISCSALQLALFGLTQESADVRSIYAAAARYMMNKHQCLQQLKIPDCRMRGATLRYWEALDIYFVPNQVMNSPHGWTAWKIYASYYLYLLTGELFYLTDFMETLGACAQIMDLSGNLRWGFVPDPYVKGKVCVERPDLKNHPMEVDSIIGEQYLDMISPWLRPDDENTVCKFGERGGAGDNTVQEIFKAMEECALTSAYVYVNEMGEVRSYNCRVSILEDKKHGCRLLIYPSDSIIRRIHLNSKCVVYYSTFLQNHTYEEQHFQGMKWVGRE